MKVIDPLTTYGKSCKRAKVIYYSLFRCKLKAAWQKWRVLAGVLCDAKMQKYLKGKVYKTMIRPVLMYGAETWTVTGKEEGLLERTEMRMLWWIFGVSLKDKKWNEVIRKARKWHALLTKYERPD